MSRFELHITNKHQPIKALALLQQETQLPVAELKSAIAKGALWLEKGNSVQRLRRVKKLISTGETLHFYYDLAVLSQPVPKAILIDDQQAYSIWYKPCGMLTNGSKWSDHCTITRFAQLNLPDERPCFLVHRLDRATTGLIIIAHSKKAARAFSQLFERHDLTKTYQAIVSGYNENKASDISVHKPVNEKQALSHFHLKAPHVSQGLALYEITIETGRKHQIRQHANYLGMPIVGDRLYGSETINNKYDVDLQLCACKLAFACPLTGQTREYQLPQSLLLSLNHLISSNS